MYIYSPLGYRLKGKRSLLKVRLSHELAGHITLAFLYYNSWLGLEDANPKFF